MKKKSLLVICILSTGILSAQIYEVPISKRIKNSDLVIEGKVLSKNSYWDEKHASIYTSNEIEVYKVFKGKISSQKINIITPGGIVGEEEVIVEPSLYIAVDEIGVFTCIPATAGSLGGQSAYEPYASVQGFIKYNSDFSAQDPFSRYTDVETDLFTLLGNNPTEIKQFNYRSFIEEQTDNFKTTAVSISGFSTPSTPVIAGTKMVLTINGSGFGATQGNQVVWFANADMGGLGWVQACSNGIISWSDTQIKVEIPNPAGTGKFGIGTAAIMPSVQNQSPTPLTITSNWTNTGCRRHLLVDINTTGGYTVQMNDKLNANTPAKNAFIRALDTWRCATKLNFTIGNPTSIDAAAIDGVNVVRFGSLPAGGLGLSSYYLLNCGADYKKIQEFTITFNDAESFEYGPGLPNGVEYDFESVALHELGHVHGLGHVMDINDIMYYTTEIGEINRSLPSADLGLGNAIYAASKAPNSFCGTATMTDFVCTQGETELSSPIGFRLFPNPVSEGYFRIQSEENFHENTTLEISTVFGEKVLTLNITDLENNYAVNQLSGGIYLYTLIKDSKTKAGGKLVILK